MICKFEMLSAKEQYLSLELEKLFWTVSNKRSKTGDENEKAKLGRTELLLIETMDYIRGVE